MDTDYIYNYTYDGRNNVLTKKTPEKTLLQMRYNLRDLVTHYKDGIQPVIYTKYDLFGRTDQTGFVSSLMETTFTSLLSDNDYITTISDAGFGQLDKTKFALLDGTGMPTGDYVTTDVISWDSYQRPIIIEGNHPLNLTSTTSYKMEQHFNSLDQVKDSRITVNIDGTNWITLAESMYDHSGRISEEYFTVAGVRKRICETTAYNPWDAIET